MSAALLRPTGFAPSGISKLVNQRVVQTHAVEAAFLWMQRDRAVDAPHTKLDHLARLDRRLEGHLEGLRVSGPAAWTAIQRQLEHCDAGTVFATSYLAFAGADPGKMRFVLQLGLSAPAFRKALIAALAWLAVDSLQDVLSRLDQSPAAAHRCVALAVRGAHRLHDGASLTSAARAEDPALRARALRAMGEAKRRDLLPLLWRSGQDPDPLCRFWAGWSLGLLGERSGAKQVFDAGREVPLLARAAVEVAMRFGETEWARTKVRELAADPSTLRLALVAAGALGDPAAASWLLAHAADPQHARVAAEAFSMITGADLDYLGLKQDAPEAEADPQAEDQHLPWPRVKALQAWWKTQRGSFVEGQRYLAGHVIRPDTAATTLRWGYQRQRRAAALELARLREELPPFPVAARADWQRQRLAG